MTGTAGVVANLAAYLVAARAAYLAAAAEIAELLKAYALENHPWQNRTGDTEASIDAQIVDVTDLEIIIAVAAGMDYDVFLELAHGGNWAWLWPAVMANQDEILAIVAKHGIAGSIGRMGVATTQPQLVTPGMQGVMDGANGGG